jgi:hypothetical protein
MRLEDFDRMTPGEDGALYWNGERIVTEVFLQLPTWVDVAVGVAAAATVVMFLVSVAERLGWIKPRPQAPINLTVNVNPSGKTPEASRTSNPGASEG